MTNRTLDIGSVSAHWNEEGSGRPTILIHGLPTSHLLWRHVVPRLEGARAIAWEMVGYGSSMKDQLSADLSLSAQADYIAAAMQVEGLNSAVLVGHDLGGGVAQILAVRHPELAGGLVLVDSVGYDSWPIAPVKRLRSLGGFVRRLPRALVRRMIRRMILRGHDDRGRGSESFETHWAFYAATSAGAALVRQLRALDTSDTVGITEKLRRLYLPTRVVWGLSDPYQRIDYARRFAIDLSAPLDPIEGARHFTPEDHPERVAASVNSLLRELSQSRPTPVRGRSTATRSARGAQARSE